MPKKIVKRCIRPQCMEMYEETEKNKFCMCGALLQIVEIEVKSKRGTYKKNGSPSNPKVNRTPKPVGSAGQLSEAVVEQDFINVLVDDVEAVAHQNEQTSSINDYDEDATQDEAELDFFGDDTVEEERDCENETPESRAFLYLLLDDADVEFELSSITRIGRAADGVKVDIDLSMYAGKDVSREHAVIQKEKDGYHITNVSRNHSVRIMSQDDNEVALEYGKKVLLKSEDGILLSKKVLLQFVEEE